ncbi:membrane hypothetical protein [uncultured spirochete]|uniref:Major facilitator superfamily (MFS) profile domain-containing protein n=1 Tax=uncultured spirochete TaxID=156406 RepID=A0A3P3XGP0_9SPIR|nr:membrane hypothetical protein [uncultured spirochete]
MELFPEAHNGAIRLVQQSDGVDVQHRDRGAWARRSLERDEPCKIRPARGLGKALGSEGSAGQSAGGRGAANQGVAPAGQSAEPALLSSREIRGAIFSARFVLMWLVFFLNITAGIMFIGFQSPMIQDMVHAQDPGKSAAELAGVGATLIAISSMFNGFGRLFWGGLSDRIGRTRVFRIILGSQVLVFVELLFVRSPMVFGMLVCYVLLCYGGGFGAMPSYIAIVFGPRMMAVVYGAMLTAWSAGGIVGSQIVAFIKDRWPGGAVAASAAQAGAKVAQVAGGAAAGVNTGAAAAGAGPGVRVAAGAANVAAAGPAAMTAASWIFLIGAALLALGFGLSFLLSDGENLRKGV